MSCLDVPVALIAFKRPEHTARVLDAIRTARPSRLFVIADGPRPGVAGDAEAVAATRALIESRVDWPCDVVKLYAETNLGCRLRPPSGLDAVFERVPWAIVLEDDCVPEPSFFGYCAEVLERYRDDPRVMHVSGSTQRRGRLDTPGSYYLSRFPSCWGWATWARAWRLYQRNAEAWAGLRDTGLVKRVLADAEVEAFWSARFDEALEGTTSTWDYQWALACWANGGLAARPRVNLIRNIGFGDGATHTHDRDNAQAEAPTEAMPLPLRHPTRVEADADLDAQYVAEVLRPHATSVRPERSPLRRAVGRCVPRSAKDAWRRLDASWSTFGWGMKRSAPGSLLCLEPLAQAACVCGL